MPLHALKLGWRDMHSMSLSKQLYSMYTAY